MDAALALSTCWKLVGLVTDIVNRVEETREHGRALKRLHATAKDFLKTVNSVLVGLDDASPYLKTISKLQQLLRDILNTSTDYVQRTGLNKFVTANATKRAILDLDRRLSGFVDTYLVRTATETILRLSAPVQRPEVQLLLSDNVRWELLSSGGTASDRSTRDIPGWLRGVTRTRTTPGTVLSEDISSVSDGHHVPPRSPNGSVSVSQTAPASPVDSGVGLENSIHLEPTDTDISPTVYHSLEDFFDTTSPPVPSLPADGWCTYGDLVMIALNDMSARSYFLTIFSVAEVFEKVLGVLASLFRNSLLLDTSRVMDRVPVLVASLATKLWLAQTHIDLISDRFDLTSNSRVPRVAVSLSPLTEVLPQHAIHDTDALVQLLESLHQHGGAERLAEALAFLEDELRRADPVGECIRWVARGHVRDLLSFPERVQYLVLHSILVVRPEQIKKYCELFYEVAVCSKKIQNFSAMRSIVSTLISLTQLREQTLFKASQLDKMKRLTYAELVQSSRNATRPYLHSLQDIFASHAIEIPAVVDGEGIHWITFQRLYDEVKEFLSRRDVTLVPTTSDKFPRGRLMDCVKKALINVEPVNAEHQDKLATTIYLETNAVIPIF